MEKTKPANVEAVGRVGILKPDPDDLLDDESTGLPSRSSIEKLNEPDPDEIGAEVVVVAEGEEPDPDEAMQRSEEPDPDESTSSVLVRTSLPIPVNREQEPDPDDSRAESDPDDALSIDQNNTISRGFQEPDPDDMLIKEKATEEPDPDESMHMANEPDPDESIFVSKEPDPDESGRAFEPDPDENAPDLDLGTVNDEIARIHDTTAAAMTRLQNAIHTLKQQASPAETTAAIRTLFTILRYAYFWVVTCDGVLVASFVFADGARFLTFHFHHFGFFGCLQFGLALVRLPTHELRRNSNWRASEC